MAKFVCPKCGIKQDVPLIGWHFVERKAGIQHFDNCGEAVPDPNDPLKLTCQYGHDHKMLVPIHWECGCLFEHHPEL